MTLGKGRAGEDIVVLALPRWIRPFTSFFSRKPFWDSAFFDLCYASKLVKVFHQINNVLIFEKSSSAPFNILVNVEEEC